MAKHIVPLYADLIDGMDADGQQLVADLHAFFNPALPSRLQAAPRLVAPRTLGPKWHWPQWHWPRTALVTVLGIFALVGATYIVALPLLQSLWSEDRGLQHVTQAGLARELNLRQTMDGVTVHVQRGYADANRVAIGYSVEFPPTAPGRHSFSGPILTDDHGNTYPSLGFSTTGDSPLGAQLHNFAPLGVTAGRDIAFTLTIPEVVRAPSESGMTVDVFRGPWVFNFTLPMAAARVVERTQTFTRPGVELTITRIVVAPSATRFEYRVHLEGFTDRAGASLVLSGSGVGHGNNGYVTPGYVSPGPAGGSGGSFCQPDVECSYLLREPLLDADALYADAWISIPEYCPPRQKCEVGRDGKPLVIRIDGLVLPLR